MFMRRPACLQILTGVIKTLPPVITRLVATVAVLLCVGGYCGGGASAAPGRDAPGGLTFGGLQRTYLVHAPAGLANPTGLVLNLHGAGATGGEQAAITNFNAVADQHGFVVVYPDGLDRSWADGRGAPAPDRQGVDDVGFLVALVDQVTQDYRIDRSRVFATGMSAGAFMATRLACERADVVAAIAPVAGTLASALPCAPSRPVSVLQVHGTADPVVPYGGGVMVGRGGVSDIVAAPAMAERWRALDGCPAPAVSDGPVDGGDGTRVERVATSGCAGGTEVDFVRIDGGGHTWPAGRFSLPAASVGPTTRAFDASQASGQFFALHGR
jgi:polyhydroxybutyrate depolymerase